jgi:predicted nucleic acid-binding Zn ribbon protein
MIEDLDEAKAEEIRQAREKQKKGYMIIFMIGLILLLILLALFIF